MKLTPAAPFGRLATAMVTPFRADGSLDLVSAKRLAAKLVADGCDTLLLSGTTGESPTTHRPEKEQLIGAVREAVGPDVFLLAGASSNDTAHAVSMGRQAAAAGADGLLVVSPYYNRPSQRGLVSHVKAVAAATELPIMLYDIPGRTGLAFGDEALAELAQIDQIKAVKDATGDVPRGAERADRTGLVYYSGDDALNFSWLAHGAAGVVSVVSHVAAPSYARMIAAIDNADWLQARRISAELRPLVNAIMGSGQGAVMAKHALALMGIIETPTLRLPLVEAEKPQVDQLRAALSNAGLL